MKKTILIVLFALITLYAQKIPYPKGNITVNFNQITSYQLSELKKEYKNVYCEVSFGIYDMYTDKDYFIDNANLNKNSIVGKENRYVINIKSTQIKNLVSAYVSQSQSQGCTQILLTNFNVVDYKNDFNISIYDIEELFAYIKKVSSNYGVEVYLEKNEFISKEMEKLLKLLKIKPDNYIDATHMDNFLDGFDPYLF